MKCVMKILIKIMIKIMTKDKARVFQLEISDGNKSRKHIALFRVKDL